MKAQPQIREVPCVECGVVRKTYSGRVPERCRACARKHGPFSKSYKGHMPPRAPA